MSMASSLMPLYAARKVNKPASLAWLVECASSRASLFTGKRTTTTTTPSAASTIEVKIVQSTDVELATRENDFPLIHRFLSLSLSHTRWSTAAAATTTTVHLRHLHSLNESYESSTPSFFSLRFAYNVSQTNEAIMHLTQLIWINKPVELCHREP